MSTYLVVEAALRLEMIEELAVRFASPELHVGDLEVTPDLIACATPSARAMTTMIGCDIHTVAHVVAQSAVLG